MRGSEYIFSVVTQESMYISHRINKWTHTLPVLMHTQVFSASCPGMFQLSFSRVLMWAEGKGKNLEEMKAQ